jgi:hypothetical protein
MLLDGHAGTRAEGYTNSLMCGQAATPIRGVRGGPASIC